VFFDELARAAGKDPSSIGSPAAKRGSVPGGRDGAPVDRARLASALALAGEKARWSVASAEGRGRGVACASYDGRTPAAGHRRSHSGPRRVARRPGRVRGRCGIARQPDGNPRADRRVGSLGAFGSRTEITLKNGRVEQSSFKRFPDPAFSRHAESRDAHRRERGRAFGMGEPPVPIALAAIVNALSAASGRRLRRVPVNRRI
jgi:isoquinoline 1-oxidoreductase beta subunit